MRCTWDNDGVMAFSSVITRSKLHSIKCLEISEYQYQSEINALLSLLLSLEVLSLF